MTLNLSKYAPVISTQEDGKQIYDEIVNNLKTHKTIELDFNKIESMATYCAKQIFGKLYLELSPKVFFEKIIFRNTNEDIKMIIRMGIQSALEG